MWYYQCPRPPRDTGHGFHDTWNAYGGPPDLKSLVAALRKMGITWYKLLAADEGKAPMARKLQEAGIQVVVRLYAPHPHPDHVVDEGHVKAYRDAGVVYFEWGNEPNLVGEWNPQKWTGDPKVAAGLIIDQHVRNAKIIEKHGGIPVFPAFSPGGNIDHRVLTRAVCERIKTGGALKGAFARTVIGSHPRPLNHPPDVWFSDTMTTAFDEVNWFAREWHGALGWIPGFIATEHGYSPGDRSDPSMPPITDELWADYNEVLVRRLNPLSNRAHPDYLLATCYWLIHSAGSVWHGDGPFANGNWPGDTVRPDDRAWGKRLWAIGPEVTWHRAVGGVPYLLRNANARHFHRATRGKIAVVVHSSDSPPGASSENTAQYLLDNSRKVSVHEYVGKENGIPVVYVMLDDDKVAYHAGAASSHVPGTDITGADVNEVTWGIEIFQVKGAPTPPELVDVAVERVARACLRFGVPAERVFGHRECDPSRRQDPVGVDMDVFRARVKRRMEEIAAALGGRVPSDAPPPEPPSGDLWPTLVNVPDWVSYERYPARPGETVWRLERLEYLGPESSGGLHHIFVEEPHNPNVVLVCENQAGNRFYTPLDKPQGEPAGNFPMWAGNEYRCWVQGGGATGSDVLSGLQLPANHHVVYRTWWRKVTVTADRGAWRKQLLDVAQKAHVLPLNPDAALQKAILMANVAGQSLWVPTSPEFDYHDWNGEPIVAQRAEDLLTGNVRVYWARKSNVNTVFHEEYTRDEVLEVRR